MQIFSRLLLIFILLLSCHTQARDLNLDRDGKLLHLSIKIPKDHKIYVSSIEINLDQSKNVEDYEVILPSGLNDGLKFYEDYLPLGLKLYPNNPDVSMEMKGGVEYELCNNTCTKEQHQFDIKDFYIDNNYFYYILFFAFLGGFILNFMPCVLPILSLKIFSILKTKGNKNHLIFSILGIFTIFWSLGFLSIWLKNIGQFVGMGMHFQEPFFIICLTILMSVFTSNIMTGKGVMVPQNIANIKSQNHILNSYISGLLAAIFSTPCTAPFLGSAIAFAASATNSEIFLIFSMIGLGFSLPYILLILCPSILNIFPKPGSWMENIKLGLAVLMIITILWLISILQAQIGYRAAFGVILLLMLVKFVTEQSFSLFWKSIAYVFLFACLFTLPQMAGKEDADKEQIIQEVWKEFEHDTLDEAIKEGKIIVIDITADWCGTCKFNKFRLWNRDHTIKLLSHPKILPLRKDITSRSLESEQFMQSIGVYGIPFNIVFGPKATKGIILPTLVSFDDLEDALAKAGL